MTTKEPFLIPFEIWNLMSSLGNIVYHGKILTKIFPWIMVETSFSNQCHEFKEVFVIRLWPAFQNVKKKVFWDPNQFRNYSMSIRAILFKIQKWLIACPSFGLYDMWKD